MGFNIVTRPFWHDLDEFISSNQSASGVSVSEDDKQVYISAPLPGLDESEIDLTFDKGMLWIKGEHEEQEEDDKRKYYSRSSTSFSYSVAVPGEIDPATDPQATYKNGVMTVVFKKSPQSQPKKITVKSGK